MLWCQGDVCYGARVMCAMLLTGVDVDSFGMAESQGLLQGNKVHVIAGVDCARDAKYTVCN